MYRLFLLTVLICIANVTIAQKSAKHATAVWYTKSILRDIPKYENDNLWQIKTSTDSSILFINVFAQAIASHSIKTYSDLLDTNSMLSYEQTDRLLRDTVLYGKTNHILVLEVVYPEKKLPGRMRSRILGIAPAVKYSDTSSMMRPLFYIKLNDLYSLLEPYKAWDTESHSYIPVKDLFEMRGFKSSVLEINKLSEEYEFE